MSTEPGREAPASSAGTRLTVHEGDLVITAPGTVIDSMEIRGSVTIHAADVTIRNSTIVGRSGMPAVARLRSGSPGASVTVEDSELDAACPSANISGVMGSNFTLRRVNIHDVIDQTHIFGDNVTIESSWLHGNSSPWATSGTARASR